MRELSLLGAVALAFGLGALRMQGGIGPFSILNLAIALVGLGGGALLALRRMGERSRGMDSPALREGLLGLVALLWAGVIAIDLSARADWRFDLTFERHYELSDALVHALEAAPDLRMTLYADDRDPRLRRTRLLLEVMADVAGAELRERRLEDHPKDEDHFGIASSNSVVLERGARWELVDRPGEGPIFEALSRLTASRLHRVYLAVGTGEGDLESTRPSGYSGLAAALETEHYEVAPLPTAFVSEIPADAELLLVIAPERRWRPEALDALRAYLSRGGRLVAMIEPGRQTGLEEVLAEWGLASPDQIVIDLAFGEVDGEAAGTAPVAFNYANHPITRGLDRNRVTFFRGARAFQLHKPQIEDNLTGIVLTSADAWLSDDASLLDRSRGTGLPARPTDARNDYHPIVAAGRYLRASHEARMVAFGDADFASNRYLRTLYNLDLVMNAMHWSVERESAITLRPKAANVVQFPLPVQSTLRSFYGVGLLIPELLLLAAGWAWLRTRNA